MAPDVWPMAAHRRPTAWSCKIRIHRVPGDVVAEVGERAADPRVAPHRMLTRHPPDEFGHRPGRHRPSPTSASPAIVLLGDQAPVPAENRVRRDDACPLTHDPPAEFLASHCASTALGVGQAKRSRTKVLPEDAMLFPERVDAIFLVAIHPASQGQHEEVQSVGHGLRLRGSDTAVTHVVFGDSLASAVFSHHTGSLAMPLTRTALRRCL